MCESNQISTYKQRLYESYVSSGQARVQDKGLPTELLLRPRRAYFRRLISSYIPKALTSRIIDLGCGYGASLYFLSRAGYENILGIDDSAEQVAMAHRLGIPNVERGDIKCLLRCMPAISVDVILVMDILEHFTADDLFAVLDDILRVLRPGGRCIAHVPNAEGLFGMRARYGDFTHEQAFTRSSAEQIFRSVGFANIACYEDRPVVHGIMSAIRRIVWVSGTVAFRMILAAESPKCPAILSQNMLLVAVK